MPRRPAPAPGSIRSYRNARRTVLDRDGWRCVNPHCRRPVHNKRDCARKGCDDCAHVDHIIHLRDAPQLIDQITNLRTLCRRCNLTRGVGQLPRARAGRPAGAGVGAGRSLATGLSSGPTNGASPPEVGQGSPAGRLPRW